MTNEISHVRVLLVEDDSAHAKLVERAFASIDVLDADLQIVGSVSKARKALRDGAYDLALVDIRLPDGEGLDLLETPGVADSVPVVILTSHIDQKVTVRALKAGALDFIVKSDETFSDLPRIVIRTLREWEHMQQAKRAEAERRQSEERFRQLADTITDVFWMLTPDYSRFSYVSPAYEHIWGRKCEDLYRDPNEWLNAVHPFDRDWVAQLLAKRRLQTRFEDEYRIVRPDGSIRWIRDRGSAILDEHGQVSRVAGIAEDITDRRAAEEERYLLQRQLQHAQKMEAIGQLTGGIAHDFNNILAIVMGYSGLAIALYDEKVDSRLRDYLQQIYKAGERARDLINQMLAFSRDVPGNKTKLSLPALITEIIKMLRPTLPASIEVKTDFDDTVPEMICDPVQLQQVVMNLCINARDAMREKGEITIKVAMTNMHKAVCASCHKAFGGNYVVLSVTDTGEGIDSRIVGRIFDPFFTTKDVGKGTGMGLAMVHGVVHENHGHILVDAEPRKGAQFRIFLPASESGQRESELAEKHPPIHVQQMDLARKTVMVIDDEESIAQFLTEFLRAHDINVITETDSERAAARLCENPRSVDLIITDQTMPKVSGIDLAQRVLARRPDMPIILCTGHSTLVSEATAHELGIKRFVRKPLEPEVLLRLVLELLTEGAAQRQRFAM